MSTKFDGPYWDAKEDTRPDDDNLALQMGYPRTRFQKPVAQGKTEQIHTMLNNTPQCTNDKLNAKQAFQKIKCMEHIENSMPLPYRCHRDAPEKNNVYSGWRFFSIKGKKNTIKKKL